MVFPASFAAGGAGAHGRTIPLPAIDRSVFTYWTYGIFLTRAFEDVATRAWPIDFCHDFQPIVSPGATGARGQGIASAFGTPVDWGCNDSVVADYRRIPSGSRRGERAGARIGAHLRRGGR